VTGDLDCGFLHEGRPKQRLRSRFEPLPTTLARWQADAATAGSLTGTLLRILALPDVASKEWIIRQYDHEVQGCSVIKPLLGPGAGPADGTVIRGTLGKSRGLVLGVGLRHRLGRLDPYQMAAGGIVEAITNVVAAGADPERIALLDNFCWGDTRREESLGTLVEACRACHDMAIAFAAPFVSGKDSLNNVFAWTDARGEPREISIPPTLLATALGQVADVARTTSPDLKQAGNRLAVVGGSRPDTAGSQLELAAVVSGGRVPQVDAAACRAACEAVSRARSAGMVQGCHDVSDGGLVTAVAEMTIAGALGARLELAAVPFAADEPLAESTRDLAIAFGETPGRFVCEVRPADAAGFAAAMQGVPWAWIGAVVSERSLEIVPTTAAPERVTVDQLAAAWRGAAEGGA
jgi:phosphoribosylformylglycinamidine synthase